MALSYLILLPIDKLCIPVYFNYKFVAFYIILNLFSEINTSVLCMVASRFSIEKSDKIEVKNARKQ